MPDAFALVDCNNFYVSCEQLFNPKLLKRPVVVLSNNDGCIISRSDEAKQIGVKMGAPLFKAQKLLDENNAAILSSNYELYGDMSARVMKTLQHFTPEIEIYSIDEAFLGFETKRADLDKIGVDVKEKVKKWTGLPVAIGIAETKTLSKIANRIARKSAKAKGVLNLYRSPYINDALKMTEIGDVWGIGRNTVEKLLQHNIKTAFDLSLLDMRCARKLLTVVGARIVLELRGVSCLSLETVKPKRLSVTCSRSFGQAIENYTQMREAVAVFIARAAEKLRREKLAAKSVTVFIITDRFRADALYYSNSYTENSAYPTDTTFELQKLAFSCLDKIFVAGGHLYRKAGVILSNLISADGLNGRLFEEKKWENSRRVMRAVDEINRKFGREKIHLASANPKGIWQGKCERRSNRYTTRFDEILTVN